MKKKKYKIVDIFEGCPPLLVGYADNKNEVKKLMRQHVKDTDGECWLEVGKLDEETMKYKLVEDIKI